MDAELALKIGTFVGCGYAGQCILMPGKYLSDQGVTQTPQTEYMVKGLTGGVIGITVGSALAAFYGSPEMQRYAVLMNLGAFSYGSVSSLMQVTRPAEKDKPAPVGPKVDLGICTVMMAVWGSTFL
jgi:hypothetical protein